ncbi:MAG: hypothetical protein P8L74_00355 [Gammaproteobacteria bacterium]|nr:hypothetical protein [Gammaproteobacteria bacterium]
MKRIILIAGLLLISSNSWTDVNEFPEIKEGMSAADWIMDNCPYYNLDAIELHRRNYSNCELSPIGSDFKVCKYDNGAYEELARWTDEEKIHGINVRSDKKQESLGTFNAFAEGNHWDNFCGIAHFKDQSVFEVHKNNKARTLSKEEVDNLEFNPINDLAHYLQLEREKEKPLVGIQCDEDHRAVIYGFESEDQLIFKNLRTLQKIPESINVWNLDNTFSKKIFTYRNFDGFQDSSVYNPIREVLDTALVFDDAHANYEILKKYEYDAMYKSDFAKSQRLKDRKGLYRYIVSRVDFSIIHSHPTFQLDAGRVEMRYKKPEDYFWGGISLKDLSSSCVQKDGEELAAYMDVHDKELKEKSEQNKKDTLKKRKF